MKSRHRPDIKHIVLLCGLLLISGSHGFAQVATPINCIELVRAAYRQTAEMFSAENPYRFQCRYRAVEHNGEGADTLDTFMEMSSFGGVMRYSVGGITTYRDPVSMFVVYDREKLIYGIGLDTIEGSAEGPVSMFRDTLFEHVTLVSCTDSLGPGREPLTVVVLELDLYGAAIYGCRRLTYSIKKGTAELEGMSMEYLPGHSPMWLEMSGITADYNYRQGELHTSAAAFILGPEGRLRPEYGDYAFLDRRKNVNPTTTSIPPEAQ